MIKLKDVSAVILCGGYGTRLKEILQPGQPKAMADIHGRPFIEILMNRLITYRFKQYLLCTGYGDDYLRFWLDCWLDSKKARVTLQPDISDTECSGTFLAAFNAAIWLSGDFFVINGDTYCEIDYRAVFERHQDSGVLATVCVDKNGINTGTMILSRRALDLGFSKSVKSIEEVLGVIVLASERLLECQVDTDYYDIGTPEGLAVFRNIMEARTL